MKGEERKRVERLYGLYGFTEAENTNKSIVFTYSNGYFDNAEIVQFEKDDEQLKRQKQEYKDWGFSVREQQYVSLERLHDSLFKGFFGIENINKKLLREYSSFRL